jgi:hypothetical protein
VRPKDGRVCLFSRSSETRRTQLLSGGKVREEDLMKEMIGRSLDRDRGKRKAFLRGDKLGLGNYGEFLLHNNGINHHYQSY